MLECSHLNIGYNRVLIQDINIHINKPGLYLIYGCNGCGKTTFFKTLAGLIQPISGNIQYDNTSLIHAEPLTKSKIVSFCFNNPIAADITLRELLLFTTDAIGITISADHTKIANQLQISQLLDISLQKLSDGQRQKALIARALVQQTPIVLLDEPTAFLDYKNKIELIHFLWHLAKNENKIIIINSHDREWLQVETANVFGINDERFFSFEDSSDWSKITQQIYGVHIG